MEKIKLPDYVEQLANRHFHFFENDCVIKKRVKGLAEGKQPLYVWDLSRACYISSLKEVKKGVFIFDVKGGESFNLFFNENNGEISIKKVGV